MVTSHRRSRLSRATYRVGGYSLFVALSLASIGPLLWMVVTSVKPQGAVFNGPLSLLT